MAIIEIKIDTIEPFADGQAFGEAGSYLRIKGIAKGEGSKVNPSYRFQGTKVGEVTADVE